MRESAEAPFKASRGRRRAQRAVSGLVRVWVSGGRKEGKALLKFPRQCFQRPSWGSQRKTLSLGRLLLCVFFVCLFCGAKRYRKYFLKRKMRCSIRVRVKRVHLSSREEEKGLNFYAWGGSLVPTTC